MNYFAGAKLHASDLVAALLAPAAFIYQTSVQSIPNNTWTKLTVDTVEFDTNGIFVPASNRLVPGQLGVFDVEVSACYQAAAAASGGFYVAVYKNGSPTRRSPGIPAGTAAATAPTITVPIQVTVITDYFEIWTQQSSGAAVSTRSDSTFASSIGISYKRALS